MKQIKATPSVGAMNSPTRVSIEEADNGYIVRCNEYDGEAETCIAKNMNEAMKMAKNMMTKKDEGEKDA